MLGTTCRAWTSTNGNRQFLQAVGVSPPMTGSLKISSRCNTIITAIRRELPPKRATNIAEVVIHTRFTAIEETADFPRRRVSGDNSAFIACGERNAAVVWGRSGTPPASGVLHCPCKHTDHCWTAGSRSLNQTLLQGHDHSDPTRAHAEFSADIGQVVIHPCFGTAEDHGDFPGRLASEDPLQDFFFPGGEGDFF